MNLYPAILTDAKAEAQKEIIWIAAYDKIRTVQVDVIDGLFADNITITPSDLVDVDLGELSVDLHLMTEEPLDYVYETVAQKEQHQIRSIIAQVERMSDQASYIETVRKQDWLVGLSLDLYTPFDSIEEESWSQLDVVQLMGIEAGFQGQDFNKIVLEKIKNLVVLRDKIGRKFEIIIDGGVKPSLIEQIEAAGADGVVVGSGLWESDNLDETVENLTEE
jgi:ribulose-phosphate 3-epimerase